MIRAVVFDFDGVVIDSEMTIFQAWTETFASHGCELTVEEWAGCIGTIDAFDEMAVLRERATVPIADEEAILQATWARHREMVAALDPMAGVSDWFDQADELGLPLAIASSSSAHWVGINLERLGIRPRFKVVSTRTEELRPKPAPDVYVNACRQLGVPPGDAMAVEDSQHGLVAAKAAGLHCIAVPHDLTRHMDFTAADLVVSSLAEVPLAEVLARLD